MVSGHTIDPARFVFPPATNVELWTVAIPNPLTESEAYQAVQFGWPVMYAGGQYISVFGIKDTEMSSKLPIDFNRHQTRINWKDTTKIHGRTGDYGCLSTYPTKPTSFCDTYPDAYVFHKDGQKGIQRLATFHVTYAPSSFP